MCSLFVFCASSLTSSQKPSKIAIPQRGIRTPSPLKSSRIPGLPNNTKQTIPPLVPRERVLSKPVIEVSKRPEPARAKQIPQARRASKAEQTDKEQQIPFPLSRETVEPRLELLHAHAIHRSSNRVQTEWERNARMLYEKKFLALQRRSLELDEGEIEMLEQKNAAAILSLTKQADGTTIEKQVQKASSIIDEVWRLTSPDGKYTSAIRAFEQWLAAAIDIHAQRERYGATQGKTEVIEGLGDGWKAEVSALSAAAVEAAKEILTLGEISPEGSDFQRCITSVSETLTQMLEELELVSFIEDHTMQEERSWVERSINRIASGLNDVLESLPGGRPTIHGARRGSESRMQGQQSPARKETQF